MSLLDKASLILTPNGYKEGKLYSVVPNSGVGDMTVTRATTATRVNSQGFIEETPYNLLRYSDGNLSTYPTISYVTNAIIPINGFSNSIQFPNTATLSTAYKSFASTVGTIYSISFYIEMDDGSVPIIGDSTGTGNFAIVLSGAFGINAKTITPINNNVYRISTYYTPTTTNINYGIVRYATQIIKGFKITGIQLVAGSVPKDYFPTTDRLNVPRIDYSNGGCPSILVEPQRTNSIRNSTMQGAVAGSPGAFPTNWGIASAGGLSTSVISVGTENGLSYVDLRISGTAIGSVYQLRYEANNNIIASVGQVWTATSYLKKIAEPAPPLSYRAYISDHNSAGSELAGSSSGPFGVTTSLQRFTYTRTLTNALTERVVFSFLPTLTIGATYDFTIRIAAPQMELGAYPTSYIPTVASTVTRNADTFTKSNIYTNGLITSAGGTWFIELNNNFSYIRDIVSFAIILDSNAGGFNNGFYLRHSNAAASRLYIGKTIGTTRADLFLTTTDIIKVTIKWDGVIADIFVNGIKVVSATSFTPTAMQFLNIQATDVPKYIKSTMLFPTPLTDTECISLTTL
jgi:hypothetical protein